MLQHFSQHEQLSVLCQPPEVEHTFDPRIESYLDRVCAPFGKNRGDVEAGKLRSEMRAHLESLAQAHIELGEAPETAVDLAIEQIGKTRSIKREWRTAEA